MSLLQEYEDNRKIIGDGRVCAIDQYIKERSKKGYYVMYHDIVYKQKEYELFSKWFEDSIKPFRIMKHSDDKYSVILSQENYEYDWLSESKTKSRYGDGHDYEEVFKKYIEEELSHLVPTIRYDSENGMFCLYCKSNNDAEEICYGLSCLYKNEDKMIQLIKEIKAIHFNEECDIKI